MINNHIIITNPGSLQQLPGLAENSATRREPSRKRNVGRFGATGDGWVSCAGSKSLVSDKSWLVNGWFFPKIHCHVI